MITLHNDIKQIINNYSYAVCCENLTKLNKTFTRLFKKDQLGKVYLDKIKAVLSHKEWTAEFLRRTTISSPWEVSDHDISSNWIGFGSKNGRSVTIHWNIGDKKPTK